MKTPIPLPVKSVHVRHTAPGDWTADVTFGIPDDSAHDDPTITINSGEGLELPPKAGDILMVRPPEILGHANAHVDASADEKTLTKKSNV